MVRVIAELIIFTFWHTAFEFPAVICATSTLSAAAREQLETSIFGISGKSVILASEPKRIHRFMMDFVICGIILLFLIGGLLIIVPKLISNQDIETSIVQNDPDRRSNLVLCPKMDCVRCHHSNETRQRALALFQKYFSDRSLSDSSLSRIEDSLINPSNTGQYIFYMQGLRRQPIWSWREFPANVAVAMDTLKFDHWRHFLDEYRRIEMFNRNDTDGGWKTFSFLNQGDWMSVTAKSKVAQILKNVSGLMNGCVFGNAFFSVLKPGAHIEPHVGPTNVRIRAHLAIQTPSAQSDSVRCTLTVDGVAHEWEDSQWFIFDDSFIHSVFYGYDRYRCHPADLQDRCVLILDLWHPDLSKEEIECIKKIFPSRLSDSLW